MMDSLTRRRLLALCGAGVATGVAGCTGEGDDGESSDDGDGDADGDGNGNGDGSEEGNGGTGTGQTGDGDPGDTSPDATINWASSYATDIDLKEGGTPDITQTFHEGDVHTISELGNGEVLESYRIGDEIYNIVSGRCSIEEEPTAETSVPDVTESVAVETGLSLTETTTLNDESIDVYESSIDGHENARWYVSTDTGYPAQFDSGAVTVTFHSWGATEPITPPDMECTEF